MDFDKLSFDELKTLAGNVKGFSIHHATGEEKYRAAFKEFVEENPGCLDDLTPKDSTADSIENHKAEPKAKAKDGLVKVKSDHRGIISSSVGVVDFGDDGIAEVTAEQAEHFLSMPKGFSKC